MKQLLALICLICIASACKHTEKPSRTVDIQILSPTSGSEYDKDDTVWLKANVNSNIEINSIRLNVKKLSNDSMVYSKQVQSSRQSETINEFFINEFNPHADLQMSVQTLDNDGNETGKKTVNFHCHAH